MMDRKAPLTVTDTPAEPKAVDPGSPKILRPLGVSYLWLALILLAAAGLRVYGIDWDQGHYFHPDERWLLMVTEGTSLPSSLAQAMNPSRSTLNPFYDHQERRTVHFAYGSFPVYLLRSIGHLLSPGGSIEAELNNLRLIGRGLSTAFDLGTIILVFLLGKKLRSEKVGLLGASFTAFTVLHVQLSHFFTVDTILTFFVLLAIYLAFSVAQSGRRRYGIIMGIAIGLGLGTKASVAPLFLVAAAAWAWAARHPSGTASLGVFTAESAKNAENKVELSGICMLCGKVTLTGKEAAGGFMITVAAALLAFLTVEPYALLDWWNFYTALRVEGAMVRGASDMPYTRQYLNTIPFLYQVQQTITWSTGLPLGLAAFAGLVYGVYRAIKGRSYGYVLLTSWTLPYFLLIGSFQVKYLRYMLPLLPFMSLLAADMLLSTGPDRERGRAVPVSLPAKILALAILLSSVLYALAFLNVYRQEHPWLQMSRWIYANVPPGSAIAVERWDDPLPVAMRLGGRDRKPQEYALHEMPIYDEDNAYKLAGLLTALQENDYISLSSNRLYGSVARLPDRYPITSRYYQALFGERLGFKLVASASTYPSLLGLTLVDDTTSEARLPVPALLREKGPSPLALNLGKADESFTVYDHPKALLFKKVERLSLSDLYQALTKGR